MKDAKGGRGRTRRWTSGRAVSLLGGASFFFLFSIGMQGQDANATLNEMLRREDAASQHRQHYSYLAMERSDRTGGHLWKERVAETSVGKIRLLLEEDGVPLSPERAGGERARLGAIVADPSSFIEAEKAKKNDEDKAKAMLDLLPKAFVLENKRTEGGLIRIDFHPNPDYQPQSMEEKVLHGMSGTIGIDGKALRLHEIHAQLAQDVSVGFGLATIHAGSHFATIRELVVPEQWKTTMVDTAINGRAILFKSLGKNEHVERSEIRLLPFDLSVAQAVEIVER